MIIQFTFIARTVFFGNICKTKTYEVEDEKQAEYLATNLIAEEVEKQLMILNLVTSPDVHVHTDVAWREI